MTLQTTPSPAQACCETASKPMDQSDTMIAGVVLTVIFLVAAVIPRPNVWIPGLLVLELLSSIVLGVLCGLSWMQSRSVSVTRLVLSLAVTAPVSVMGFSLLAEHLTSYREAMATWGAFKGVGMLQLALTLREVLILGLLGAVTCLSIAMQSSALTHLFQRAGVAKRKP